MITRTRICIFLLVLVLAGVAIYLLDRNTTSPLSGSLIRSIFSDDEAGDTLTSDDTIEEATTANPYLDAQGRYVHTEPGFSFAAPNGEMPVSNNVGDSWEVVTVKNFQISFYPHDEPAITTERIKLDVPDIVIKNIQYATLDGAEALVFNSSESTIGETYEVWFVHGGYLYQAMTYADKENELNSVLNTWKFQ